ncbi:MAG TPA: condensation domain-containing protein, partial [Verrucomicrobiae bacterium]|nr:condensation domain-containing protein [Verrucomicrobiae bacterium]
MSGSPQPLSARKQALLQLLLKERNERASGVAVIPRREGKGPTPLSFAQERLWFLDQLTPGNCAYNLSRAIRIEGNLDLVVLERAINEIVRRHEVLRTSFELLDGTPMQIVHEAQPMRLNVQDLLGSTRAEQEQEIRSITAKDASEPFDLGRGPLFRIRVLRAASTEHVFVHTLHHIVSDGWSVGILVREISLLYDAFLRGAPSPLPDLPVQYADYALWQRQWLQGEVLEQQLAYWREQLRGTTLLDLPIARSRPAIQTFNGAVHDLSISSDVAARLKQLSQREGVTLFMIVLAGLQVALSRYTRQQDVAIGTAIANRHRGEVEGLIGFFINTLILRTDLSDDPTVSELLQRVKEITLGAYTHQDLPFEKLVEELQPERDLSRNPLVQVALELQNAPDKGVDMPGLALRQVGGAEVKTRFDLEVHFLERGENLAGWIYYNIDLFDGNMILRLGDHLEAVLKSFVDGSQRRSSELEMLGAEERRQVLEEWNRTEREY